MGGTQDKSLEDDGLYTPEVGTWATIKYDLIKHYATMFATSMKKKWQRVYVDLFAGAGKARIKGSGRIVRASPLIALAVRDPFDRYVFCEEKPKPFSALTERVNRVYPQVDVRCLQGDCNVLVDEVLDAIPVRGALTFCVVDPFSTTALSFDTLSRLSVRRTDFFVLIASYMDAHRNEDIYVKSGDNRVARFLGDPDWRDKWFDMRDNKGCEFGAFIVKRFSEQMNTLQYLAGTPETVRLPGKNVRLYHLAFYSKDPLGRVFWYKARKSSQEHTTLFAT